MMHTTFPLDTTPLFALDVYSGICEGPQWNILTCNQALVRFFEDDAETFLGENLFYLLNKRKCDFSYSDLTNSAPNKSLFLKMDDSLYSFTWTNLAINDVSLAPLLKGVPEPVCRELEKLKEPQLRYFIFHKVPDYPAGKDYDLLWREMQVILDSIHDGIWVIDANGITVHVNKALHRIADIKEEDVLGKHVSFAMNEGLFTSCVTLHALEAQKPVTMFDDYASGKRCINTSTPIFDDEGKIWRVVASIRDMSELEMLQTKLAEAEREAKKYKEKLAQTKLDNSAGFIGDSAVLCQTVRNLEKVAKLSSVILILGATGTGKNLAATYVHEVSPRANSPFIAVNCAAIPLTLLEAELFGYEKGAFTGAALEGKKGMFELADKGTLFLDEIGELPLAMQAKLLHVLDNYSFRRVGGVKSINVDVRVIAATNQPLEELVKTGLFRADLYYRLRVLSVTLPPLCDHAEDIPLMALHFLEEACVRHGFKKFFDPKVLDYFGAYNWPGNVRELLATVEFLAAMSEGKVIRLRDLPAHLCGNTQSENPLQEQSLKEAVQQLEFSMIKDALAKTGSTYKAAELLKVSQSTIVRKAHSLRITLTEE